VAYVRKPFLAKIREVSYPIPVELPVTMATLWLAEGEEEEQKRNIFFDCISP
jgi:hypothetical protein